MNPRTTLTLSNGRGIDLLNPQACDISFEVIAEHLAKENRYNGATPGLVYSVAQHSVHAAETALEDTGNEDLAARLLLHDGHEAFFGDDTTPKKKALAAIMATFGIFAEQVEQSFARLTGKMDAAIFEAAGVAPRTDPETEALVHLYDRRMLATEWRDLMKCATPFDFGVEPFPMTIRPWSWGMAKIEFMAQCQALLPALKAQRKAELRAEARAAHG